MTGGATVTPLLRAPRRARLTTVALLACLAPFAASAQEALNVARVDSVIRAEMNQLRVPGAQLVVTQGDRVIYAKAYGISNVLTREPMTLEHRLRVGSITKMMTAITVLALAAQHRVELDAPVSRYIGGLAPAVGRVTLRQALSHSGGLNATLVFAPRSANHDEAALLAEVRSWNDSVLFTQPGEVISYSNYGLVLAGAVVAAVSGLPYADVVRQQVFQPAGMSHSAFRFPIDSTSGRLADGHVLTATREPQVVTPIVTDAAWWPAGYMYTTANDLARFAIMILNDGSLGGRRVLSPDVAALFHQSVVDEPIATDLGGNITRVGRYGFGINHLTWRGVRLLRHGGRLEGYGATLTLAPDQRVSVTILANRFNASLWGTAADVLAQLTPVDAGGAAPVPVALGAAERRQYVGRFLNSPFDELLVERGDRLIWSAVRIPGLVQELQGEVRKLSDETFEVLDANGGRIASFTFLRDAAGNVKYLARSDLRTLRRVP